MQRKGIGIIIYHYISMRKHCASKHQETLDIEKTSGEKNVSATLVGQFVAKSSSHEKWPRHPHASLGAFEPSVVTGPDVSSKFHPKFIKIWGFPDLSRGFIKFHPPKIGGFPDVSKKPHHPEIDSPKSDGPRRTLKSSASRHRGAVGAVEGGAFVRPDAWRAQWRSGRVKSSNIYGNIMGHRHIVL